jgi:hypothetical protein
MGWGTTRLRLAKARCPPPPGAIGRRWGWSVHREVVDQPGEARLPTSSASSINFFSLKKNYVTRVVSHKKNLKLGVANEGGPVPSGLGWMVHSASHNRQREDRYPSPDEICCPPPGQGAYRGPWAHGAKGGLSLCLAYARWPPTVDRWGGGGGHAHQAVADQLGWAILPTSFASALCLCYDNIVS